MTHEEPLPFEAAFAALAVAVVVVATTDDDGASAVLVAAAEASVAEAAATEVVVASSDSVNSAPLEDAFSPGLHDGVFAPLVASLGSGCVRASCLEISAADVNTELALRPGADIVVTLAWADLARGISSAAVEGVTVVAIDPPVLFGRRGPPKLLGFGTGGARGDRAEGVGTDPAAEPLG